MTTNPHEARARAVKAAKLARVLRGVLAEPGVTLDGIAGAGDEFRGRVARLAKVHPPSEATWQAAVGILSAQEQQ